MSARILIIEDNPANMELMAYLLEAFGHTALTATDGESGVRMARDAQPDLIVCDVHLPKLDGFGVAGVLRQDPVLRNIPLLAVTALAMAGDRERLMHAGFDGYIGKPIDTESFVPELERYLPGGRQAPAARPSTILIVDDHVLNREFLMTLLRYGGHRLLSASSGAEALELAQSETPDLVISDILMPNMDGYELVARLRAREETAAVPVIFYTAVYREREAEKMAAKCGVRRVLPKPSDPDVILQAVHEALGTHAPPAPQMLPAEAMGADGGIGAIEHTVSDILGRVETSSSVISSMAAVSGQEGGSPVLSDMTRQLSDSLSSLQAVSMRLTALIELGMELGSEREAQTLVHTGCQVARNICVARYACIGVLDRSGGALAHFASCGDNGQAAVVAAAPKAGVLATLLDKGTVVRMDGLGGDPREAGLPPDHPEVHSFLGVPLAARGRVHGWLYLADKLGDARFSEVDERVLATVAAQIAVSYENLVLYEETRRHQQQLAAELEQRTRMDNELRRFRAAMDASGDAIFLIDSAAGVFVDVNATACRLLGYQRSEFLAPSADTRQRLSGLLDRLVATGSSAAAEETELRASDGGPLAVEVQRSVLDSGAGRLLVAVARDIRERLEAQEALHQLARFDTLTGLPNRVQFMHALERTLQQGGKQAWTAGVLFLDLDRFKNINDTFGHATGDELLRQFSSRLVEALRARDTIARFGGDDFAAVLVLPDGAAGAVAVVDKIREALRHPFTLGEHEVTLTASIGIALAPGDTSDADTLLKYADTAMYSAKQAGRDAYRFFTSEMNEHMLARLDLENALRRALDNNEFVLYFQPKLNIATGRISGAEALLRWQRPGHGMVQPGLFIPLLEETGLIRRVGTWVIEEACRRLGEWIRAGVRQVPVSVNVSGLQFFAGDLEDKVRGALLEHGIPPELLELELTESSLMSNAEGTIEVLRNLKALGVKVSVDDFGTGYSSLAYLRRFPIDKLKIDIAFVREVTSNPDDAAIVLAIISMAHSLKLSVVAEGVESEAQLAYLRRNHCDEMQGYLFSRPVDAPAFAAMLAAGQALGPPADQPEPQQTLLIVDDDPFTLEALADFLGQEGYTIFTALDADEAFDILARHRVQVVLSDQCMPGMSGTEFMTRVKDLCPDTFRIMLSAFTDLTPILAAINDGAIDRFYTKPWKGTVLRENVREGFRLHALLQRGAAAPTN